MNTSTNYKEKEEFEVKNGDIEMENNVKDNDILTVIVGYEEKKEFEAKLNKFLEKNNGMLLENHVILRNSLHGALHILNVVIPNLNEKIDEYNTDFNEGFSHINPVINKNSENSFTIDFSAQNKQVTYDFDEIYNKLINFKGNYDVEYENMARELGLYDFVTSIEDELYTEWDKAIDNFRFSESLDDVIEHELG